MLNSSYEPLNVCTVRRAVVLVLKEKAELLETGSRELHSESMTFPHPVVIRLVTYVRVPRESAAAQDHAPGGVRPRLVDLPVLRQDVPPDRRPRAPAQPRRHERLGEHRHLLCALQPPQGRPHADRGRTCIRAEPPRAPGPTVFIRVAAPVVPPAWQQYLLEVKG